MKRLSEYIHFVYSHHETQDKCILRGVLWQNPVTPPNPLNYHTVGGGPGDARYINAQKSKKQLAQIRNGQI